MRNIEYIGDLIERTLADESYEEVNESHNKEKMMILIKNAMERLLTDRQNECFVMYYYDNMPMADIAKELGLHKSTVSRHISAVKKKLEFLQEFF